MMTHSPYILKAYMYHKISLPAVLLVFEFEYVILVLYDVNDTNDVMGMEDVVAIEASVLPSVYTCT